MALCVIDKYISNKNIIYFNICTAEPVFLNTMPPSVIRSLTASLFGIGWHCIGEDSTDKLLMEQNHLYSSITHPFVYSISF